MPMTIDLREEVLRVFFMGAAPPAEVFVGLSGARDAEGLEALESAELSQGRDGYRRARVLSSDWTLERHQDDGTVVLSTERPGFMNDGPGVWPGIWSFFVSTHPTPGGRLLGAGLLANPPRVLAPGDILHLPLWFVY